MIPGRDHECVVDSIIRRRFCSPTWRAASSKTVEDLGRAIGRLVSHRRKGHTSGDDRASLSCVVTEAVGDSMSETGGRVEV